MTTTTQTTKLHADEFIVLYATGGRENRRWHRVLASYRGLAGLDAARMKTVELLRMGYDARVIDQEQIDADAETAAIVASVK